MQEPTGSENYLDNASIACCVGNVVRGVTMLDGKWGIHDGASVRVVGDVCRV
jgi:hypothetical protein